MTRSDASSRKTLRHYESVPRLPVPQEEFMRMSRTVGTKRASDRVVRKAARCVELLRQAGPLSRRHERLGVGGSTAGWLTSLGMSSTVITANTPSAYIDGANTDLTATSRRCLAMLCRPLTGADTPNAATPPAPRAPMGKIWTGLRNGRHGRTAQRRRSQNVERNGGAGETASSTHDPTRPS